MRNLLYFPIVHNSADCGSLKDEITKQSEQKYGKEKWKRHLRYVQRVWGSIEDFINQYIETMGVQHSDIRIYQDGLPVAGELGLKIVREIARQGSRNHQILERLVEQGACLEEAESKDLLLQEYGRISRILKAETPNQRLKEYLLSQELLEKRDRYIADRINATLMQNELGLAFFGAMHLIVDNLAKDIETKVIGKFNNQISKELISMTKLLKS